VVWIGYAVAAVCLLGMAIHLSGQRELLTQLARISWPSLLALLGLSLVVVLTQGLCFAQVARIFDLRLSLREWLGLSALNTMANYTLPASGGAVLRAAYLRQRHGLPLTDYAALLASSQTVVFGCAAGFGLVMLMVRRLTSGVLEGGLLLAFAAALTISVAASLVVPRAAGAGWLDRIPRLASLLRRFGSGFERWPRRRLTAAGFGVWFLVTLILSGVRLDVAFSAIGTPVELERVLLIQAVISVFSIVSLTPGNLGIREGLAVLTANLLGIDAGLALLASLVDRAATLLVVFATGSLASHFLLRELSGRQRPTPRTGH